MKRRYLVLVVIFSILALSVIIPEMIIWYILENLGVTEMCVEDVAEKFNIWRRGGALICTEISQSGS